MNVLGRDIQVGERVVTSDGKLYEVSGGFGLKHENIGRAIFAYELTEEGERIKEGTWSDGRDKFKSTDIRYRLDKDKTNGYNESLLGVVADNRD